MHEARYVSMNKIIMTIIIIAIIIMIIIMITIVIIILIYFAYTHIYSIPANILIYHIYTS